MIPAADLQHGFAWKGCSVSQRYTEQNWKDNKVDLICSSVGFQGDPVVSLGDKSLAEFFRWILSATQALKLKRKFRIRFSRGTACKNGAKQNMCSVFTVTKSLWSTAMQHAEGYTKEGNGEKICCFNLGNIYDVYIESGEIIMWFRIQKNRNHFL